ncbi:MAG: SDR family NAD(P)-dependent oxidoreductase [Pseudomonadota bacterium]
MWSSTLLSRPPQTILITGASGGLGLAAARQLATSTATLVLGGSSASSANTAAEIVQNARPNCRVHPLVLNLQDLDQISNVQHALPADIGPIDILLLNAGVLHKHPQPLVHGTEAHMGINFIGHFALTRALWPSIQAAPAPRIVHVCSMTSRFARIDTQRLTAQKGLPAYATSKLANLIFAQTLARRSTHVASIACQPGYVATGLQRNLKLARIGNPLLGRTPAAAAKILVQAATSTTLQSGDYIGPKYGLGLLGPAGLQRIDAIALAESHHRALWQFAEAQIGATFVV